jgi:hypothetical protein
VATKSYTSRLRDSRSYGDKQREMATDEFSINDLCRRVQKLVPQSIGSETWYLIIVSRMILLESFALCFGPPFISAGPISSFNEPLGINVSNSISYALMLHIYFACNLMQEFEHHP